MSKRYNCLPSEVLGIEDSYTAFCFNEACCLLSIRLENLEEGEQPNYIDDEDVDGSMEYKSFKDFYKTIK